MIVLVPVIPGPREVGTMSQVNWIFILMASLSIKIFTQIKITAILIKPVLLKNATKLQLLFQFPIGLHKIRKIYKIHNIVK